MKDDSHLPECNPGNCDISGEEWARLRGSAAGGGKVMLQLISYPHVDHDDRLDAMPYHKNFRRVTWRGKFGMWLLDHNMPTFFKLWMWLVERI